MNIKPYPSNADWLALYELHAGFGRVRGRNDATESGTLAELMFIQG